MAKVYGIFLTERTILRFFLYLALRRKVCILGVYSYLQNHGGYLQTLVNYLHDKHRVEIISEKKDQFPYKDNGDFQRLTNIFSEAEPWMEQQFKMDSFSGEYALACKHIISNRTYALYQRNYDIFYLSESIVVPKMDSCDRFFYRHNFGKIMPVNRIEAIDKYVFNTFFFILSLLHCFAWIVSRIRLAPKKYEITLATDYNGGPRDMKFWDYLNPDRKKTLVVVRDKYTMSAFGHLLTKYNAVFDDDGSFDLAGGLSALLRSFRDATVLFYQAVHLPPDYYRQICFLPFKRIKYRAFFNKYKCSFFWGRDDYNYQHIMRSQEIRRIGGRSMGCNHGIQSIGVIAFQLRYLDFDDYYMHGLDQYRNVYHKYWPKWMKVHGIGSMFSNPEQQSLIRQSPGTDVSIIIAPSFHQDQIFKAIAAMATLFPDLRFWISTKAKHRTEGNFGKKYQELIYSGMPNISENTSDVYDVMRLCKYVFSESSTLLAEAIYFDRVALCYDPDPAFRFLYYRKFREMIFKDVEQMAARIRETRYQEVHYNDPYLQDMIYKCDEHPWDVIRRNMAALN